MTAKLCVVLIATFLALATFRSCLAAPRPSNEELLEKSIADYLRHDKQLVNELKQLGFGGEKPALDRVKRQSKVEIDTNDAEFGEGDAKEPGFFDKAAKFVVELLQRFLRWINTEDS